MPMIGFQQSNRKSLNRPLTEHMMIYIYIVKVRNDIYGTKLLFILAAI